MKYEATYDKERDVIVLRRPYTPMILNPLRKRFTDWIAPKAMETKSEPKEVFEIGDIVEVLNQDGEVPMNYGYCGRGDRGRIVRFYAEYVAIDINGKEGHTRLSNIRKA